MHGQVPIDQTRSVSPVDALAREPLEPGAVADATTSGDRFLAAVVWVGLGTALSVIALAALSVFVGPNGALAEMKLSLAAPTDPAKADRAAVRGEDPVRLAVTSRIDWHTAEPSWRALANELGRALGRPGQASDGDGYAAIVDRLRAGECDLALLDAGAFARGEGSMEWTPLATVRVADASGARHVWITQPPRQLDILDDFRGETIACADVQSFAGWLAPASALARSARDPAMFFRARLITGTHDRAVLAVAGHYAALASVDSTVLHGMLAEDPGLSELVATLGVPKASCARIMVAGPAVAESTRESLKQTLLDLSHAEHGRRILAALGIERFVPYVSADFDPARAAVRLVESLDDPE